VFPQKHWITAFHVPFRRWTRLGFAASVRVFGEHRTPSWDPPDDVVKPPFPTAFPPHSKFVSREPLICFFRQAIPRHSLLAALLSWRGVFPFAPPCFRVCCFTFSCCGFHSSPHVFFVPGVRKLFLSSTCLEFFFLFTQIKPFFLRSVCAPFSDGSEECSLTSSFAFFYFSFFVGCRSTRP